MLAIASCEKPADQAAAPATVRAAPTNAYVQFVAPQTVCMANNRYMGEDQTAVVVEGKTYYGCCPMCEQRLRDDPEVRAAKDPVTGKPVDKATAVIGKLSTGRVLYFESEKTFAAYDGRRR